MIGNTGMVRELVRYISARMDVSDRGATAVEYGMIVALIAAAIIVTVGFVGADTNWGFDQVENGVNGDQG